MGQRRAVSWLPQAVTCPLLAQSRRKATDVADLKLKDVMDAIVSLHRSKPGAAGDLRKFAQAFLRWATDAGLAPFNVMAGYRQPKRSRAAGALSGRTVPYRLGFPRTVSALPPRADMCGGWCCRCGLNTRPPPYQGGALPLSYGSESAHGRRHGGVKRGGNCHTAPGDARQRLLSCNVS